MTIRCCCNTIGEMATINLLDLEMEDIMTERINKDMIIADMLKIDPGIAAILMASGMHCIGCPSAQGESLDEAAMVHGLDASKLVDAVNEYLANK